MGQVIQSYNDRSASGEIKEDDEDKIKISPLDVALDILNDIGNSGETLLEKKRSTSTGIDPIKQLSTGVERIHDALHKRIGANKLVRRLLQKISELPDSDMTEQLIATGIIHDAAKLGNVEFLVRLFSSFPELISRFDDDNNHSIFHVAVQHRQDSVFNIIYDVGTFKDLIVLSVDKHGNNILHLAGKSILSDNLEQGPSFQMQRELLWFKEVEKIVPPSYHRMKNVSGKTPKGLFSKEHKNMLEKAENWMKGTTTACMLVATLIATVVFGAAFTVPGGSHDVTGVPIFLKARWFKVFVISDTLAMFTSTTAIIMFLSILTSRYTENDFLKSLPMKLLIGLIALFSSILSMVVAFVSVFFLIYKHDKVWLRKVIFGFAYIPVLVFALVHYKLWVDTIRSTLRSKFLFRPSKRMFYWYPEYYRILDFKEHMFVEERLGL